MNFVGGGRLLAWAWWLLVLVVVGLGAWMGRYDAGVEGGHLVAWDRWQHRFCVMRAGAWQCGPRRW